MTGVNLGERAPEWRLDVLDRTSAACYECADVSVGTREGAT